MNNDIDHWIIIVFLLTAGLICIIIGSHMQNCMIRDFHRAAVNQGCAEWVVSVDGKTTFKWKGTNHDK